MKQEYMNNIRIVDDIVLQTETLLSDFYKSDSDTSFIFTADHGMSVIGNHGDGGSFLSTSNTLHHRCITDIKRLDPDNTRTPLVAWGRGMPACNVSLSPPILK